MSITHGLLEDYEGYCDAAYNMLCKIVNKKVIILHTTSGVRIVGKLIKGEEDSFTVTTSDGNATITFTPEHCLNQGTITIFDDTIHLYE